MAEKRLIEKVTDEIRIRHYSIRTEQAYVQWILRFIYFHGKRHPAELGPEHVRDYLTNLAVQRDVSAATQNQALNAMLFLYKHVIGKDLGIITGVVRAKPRARIPEVLTVEEVRRIIDAMSGYKKLVVRLLYGSGLRLIECLRLRVKDIDFTRHTITVHGGKGDKDRMTVLSKAVVPALTEHLAQVRSIHLKDLADGYGTAWLPPATARSMPLAAREWIWQYVFPSRGLSIDPRSRATHRHHMHLDGVNKQIRDAARIAGVKKRVSAHTFRHSFATHLLESGASIHTVQALLGHNSIETTKIYLHVMRKPGQGLQSPEDMLE